MSYSISKKVKTNFEETEALVISNLKAQGFGIITEIDLQKTFKSKLDVDFRKYKILGACNPKLANKAIGIDDQVGVLLPCNVCLQELSETETEVFTVNTHEMMKLTANEEITSLGSEINMRLENVLNSI